MFTPALVLLATLAVAPAMRADTVAIAPTLQTLDLAVDPRRDSWSGSYEATLGVRAPVKRLALRLRGPIVNRVALRDRSGANPVVYAQRGADSLLVEASRTLAPGTVGLLVAFGGRRADLPPGLAGPPGGPWRLERGAGVVAPAWPEGTPRSRWRLAVHVPVQFGVRSSLPVLERSLQDGWRTVVFASRGAIEPDSLGLEIARIATSGAAR